MKPAIGCTVHYRLGEADAQHINKRREIEIHHVTGAPLHVGSFAEAGQVVPAVVTRVLLGRKTDPRARVALSVNLDGTDTHWVPNAAEGDEPGFWAWPPRVDG